jgi:methionyl-tRNA formyltransferase
MRIILTAGFPRAAHVLALAELLHRDGVRIHAIITVTPWNLRRVRAAVRTRGAKFIVHAAQRLAGVAQRPAEDPLDTLLTSHGIPAEPLPEWARRRGVQYVTVRSLNSAPAVELVRNAGPDVLLLYGGGGILRKQLIDAAGGRVLNAHSGPLPHVRGMNACEWSLLLGFTPSVTVHYIDEGIDTGPTLCSAPVPVEDGDTIDRLRSKCAALGVVLMWQTVTAIMAGAAKVSPHEARGRQCFVLAPVLKEVLELKLASRTGE